MENPPQTRPSLLVRLRDAQDREAWRQFVEVYAGIVYGFLRNRGLQDADAADLTQDVLQAVAGSVGRLDYDPSRGTFRGWLYTITRHQLSRFLGRRKRQPQGTGDTEAHLRLDEQPGREPALDALWDQEYERHLFSWAAERVRGGFEEPTWQAFWGTAVEGQSAQAVASALGMSVGAVYVARSRVSGQLKEQIRQLQGERRTPRRWVVNRPSACPDSALLRALADDTLPREQLGALSEHLDGCARCRQALDRLLADQPSWPTLAGSAPPGTPAPGPGFHRAVARLQAESILEGLAPPEEEPPALDFLSPPEGPEELGRLGPYPVLGVIGQGGMGVVLKALDPVLNRLVALKVLAPQLAASPDARKRFAREARAAAAISHEHVVAIHAVEEANGLPYLVMQYVPGLSLQQWLDRRGPLKLPEILRIGAQVASGLAAAHAQGLIHRDVKPANILLSAGQTFQPDARAGVRLESPTYMVKLTDFGLARAAGDARVTQTGVVAGTPLYMAPEQARGEPMDHRGDLFSLGSVLYALCTGRSPFEGGSALAVLRRVCDDTPPPVHEVNPEIPAWLAEIIGRLHAKDPAGRLQSAAETADLLGRHLDCLGGHPVPVSPPRPPRGRRRGRRWAVALVLLLGSLVLLVLTGGGVARLARLWSPPAPLRAWATLRGHQGPVYALAFAPDGTELATGGDDGTVRLWDVKTGRVRTTLEGHKGPVWSVCYARTGGLLASGSDDGTVKVWNPVTGRKRASFEQGAPVHGVAFARDGRRLASAGSNKRVHIWDLAGGKRGRTLTGHAGTVYAVAFSPDGRALVTGGASGTVRFWDPGTGRQRTPLKAHALAVRSLCFSPGGTLLATGSWDRTVKVWDLPGRAERFTLRGHTHNVLAVAFSSDGALLASASGDRTVRLWDVETGQPRATLTEHTGGVWAVAFSPDARTLATGSGDQSVKLWDLGAR